MDIGFDDRITSDAVDKHNSYPSVMKIRQQYGNESTFRFNRNINPRKATWYDHIPGKIVRIAHQELSFPITRLINTAITANAFPSNMKFAEISPGHKKYDNLIRGNYRPVSVLPILSKVHETVMNDQLLGYFLDKFHEFLSAFRKRYSCQSLLLKAVDDWKYALDQNLITGVVFIDLSKAFDCLPHSLLIAKLHAYGVDWSACELLADYLSHRLQRVKIGTARSSLAELSKGVPQGSILGPLLFNIFVNDLFLFIEKCTLYDYADDNSMSYSSSTLQGVLSSLLNYCKIAVEWFGNNGMKANSTKFQFMVLSPNPTDDIEFELDENTILRPQKSVKALGVIINNRLTFSDQISACCLKAARQLNALVRISKYLDPKDKNVIFNSFIRSNFEYCPLVWHFCGKTNNNKLEKIQERSLRILHDTYELSYEELSNKNGSNTLLLHRLKLFIMETYKSFHCVNANCLHGVFKFNSTSLERRSDKVIQPKRRTTSNGLRSFSYLESKSWNGLLYSDSAIANCDFNEIMAYLKQWEGPDINDSFPYVWFFFYNFECAIFYCLNSLSHIDLFSILFMILCIQLHCALYILHLVVY